MIMKKNIISLLLVLLALHSNSQALKNTSYKTAGGEKVLRIEFTLPVDLATAWKVFTTDAELKKWIAPLAHIELRSGGFIITNYDTTKTLADSSSIKLPITSFIENELLVLKVILNNNFKESVRASDENLQEVIQFKKIDAQHTQIISSMIGWGSSAQWDTTYQFFVRGNEYTYKELLKLYK